MVQTRLARHAVEATVLVGVLVVGGLQLGTTSHPKQPRIDATVSAREIQAPHERLENMPSPTPTAVPAVVAPAPVARVAPVPALVPRPVVIPRSARALPVVTPARPVAAGGIEGIIRAAAARYGANGDQMVRVARCESGFNIYAHNPSGATGLFQFMPSTFYGNGGRNLYDAYDQANTAARMFAHGQAYQWVCRG